MTDGNGWWQTGSRCRSQDGALHSEPIMKSTSTQTAEELENKRLRCRWRLAAKRSLERGRLMSLQFNMKLNNISQTTVARLKMEPANSVSQQPLPSWKGYCLRTCMTDRALSLFSLLCSFIYFSALTFFWFFKKIDHTGTLKAPAHAKFTL